MNWQSVSGDCYRPALDCQKDRATVGFQPSGVIPDRNSNDF